MDKVNFKKIERPSKGRRFAISDIHGCAETFKALLQQINFNKKDHLYLLGDLINRGPKSHEVLDHVIQLMSDGYQVYTIRGNHEQIILRSINKSLSQRKRLVQSYRCEQLLNKSGDLKKRYYNFLLSTYHYLILDDYYLVHAGFNAKAEKPFEDTKFMLYSKQFKAKRKMLGDKKVVVGHTPKSLLNIVDRIKMGKRKIIIDNGCVNHGTRNQGNLVCLDLDSLSLSIFRNIDQN